jgi:ketosteroid isomerase-like protein
MPESAPADLDVLFAILDDRVEWDYVGAFPETVTYHGPEQVREFLRQWSESFEDFGVEAEEAIDAGDCVIACVHQWGRGKETGAQVESRTWQVFRFSNGKIVHCHGYPTKAEALAAAGLE